MSFRSCLPWTWVALSVDIDSSPASPYISLITTSTLSSKPIASLSLPPNPHRFPSPIRLFWPRRLTKSQLERKGLMTARRDRPSDAGYAPAPPKPVILTVMQLLEFHQNQRLDSHGRIGASPILLTPEVLHYLINSLEVLLTVS